MAGDRFTFELHGEVAERLKGRAAAFGCSVDEMAAILLTRHLDELKAKTDASAHKRRPGD